MPTNRNPSDLPIVDISLVSHVIARDPTKVTTIDELCRVAIAQVEKAGTAATAVSVHEAGSSHDSRYYTETEINSFLLRDTIVATSQAHFDAATNGDLVNNETVGVASWNIPQFADGTHIRIKNSGTSTLTLNRDTLANLWVDRTDVASQVILQDEAWDLHIDNNGPTVVGYLTQVAGPHYSSSEINALFSAHRCPRDWSWSATQTHFNNATSGAVLENTDVGAVVWNIPSLDDGYYVRIVNSGTGTLTLNKSALTDLYLNGSSVTSIVIPVNGVYDIHFDNDGVGTVNAVAVEVYDPSPAGLSASADETITGQWTFQKQVLIEAQGSLGTPLIATNLNTGTSTAQAAIFARAETTSNMADGFGPSIFFGVEDATVAALVGEIKCVRDDNDDYQGKFVIAPYQALGVKKDVVQISATKVTINGELHVTNTSGLGDLYVEDALRSAYIYERFTDQGVSIEGILFKDGLMDGVDVTAINLGTGVTGDLPYANLTGATGATKLFGRGSAAGAGDWEEITVGSGLTMTGTTLTASASAPALNDITDVTLTTPAQGDILYRNASGWVNLGPGTSGQFLKTQGAGANPVWSTASGTGDVSKVGTPVDGQIGVWTGDGTIEGDTALTFDTTADRLAVAASGKFAFGAVDILSDAAGTTTLSNIDAIDAATVLAFEASLYLQNMQGVTTLAKGGTGATTAAGARTALDVDQAGTDNSTNVTLAGTLDYLTIAGQVITRNAIDLATDITGTLPLASGGTGATTAAAARTALDVDQAGTDNSTNVSLAAGLDYLTIAGQVITLNAVDLTTDITGTLPLASGGTGATTAAGARTALDVDQAGTDNSTNVTLAAGLDYLTIAGQVITQNAVDLTTDVSGDLPFANLTPATAASKLLGRGSAGGAGDYEEITVGSGLTMTGTTLTASASAPALGDITDVTLTTPAQGDILYRNASGWVNLAPGTSGYVLTTQGAAANPQWASPGSGTDGAAIHDNVANEITAITEKLYPEHDDEFILEDSENSFNKKAIKYSSIEKQIAGRPIYNALTDPDSSIVADWTDKTSEGTNQRTNISNWIENGLTAGKRVFFFPKGVYNVGETTGVIADINGYDDVLIYGVPGETVFRSPQWEQIDEKDNPIFRVGLSAATRRTKIYGITFINGMHTTDSVTDSGGVEWGWCYIKEWTASETGIEPGDWRKAATGSFVLECTAVTTGTVSATEPSWTKGTGFTDTGVTWTVYSYANWATNTYSATYNATNDSFAAFPAAANQYESTASLARVLTGGTSSGTEPTLKRPSGDGTSSDKFKNWIADNNYAWDSEFFGCRFEQIVGFNQAGGNAIGATGHRMKVHDNIFYNFQYGTALTGFFSEAEIYNNVFEKTGGWLMQYGTFNAHGMYTQGGGNSIHDNFFDRHYYGVQVKIHPNVANVSVLQNRIENNTFLNTGWVAVEVKDADNWAGGNSDFIDQATSGSYHSQNPNQGTIVSGNTFRIEKSAYDNWDDWGNFPNAAGGQAVRCANVGVTVSNNTFIDIHGVYGGPTTSLNYDSIGPSVHVVGNTFRSIFRKTNPFGGTLHISNCDVDFRAITFVGMGVYLDDYSTLTNSRIYARQGDQTNNGNHILTITGKNVTVIGNTVSCDGTGSIVGSDATGNQNALIMGNRFLAPSGSLYWNPESNGQDGWRWENNYWDIAGWTYCRNLDDQQDQVFVNERGNLWGTAVAHAVGAGLIKTVPCSAQNNYSHYLVDEDGVRITDINNVFGVIYRSYTGAWSPYASLIGVEAGNEHTINTSELVAVGDWVILDVANQGKIKPNGTSGATTRPSSGLVACVVDVGTASAGAGIARVHVIEWNRAAAGTVSDTAYGASWNADTTTAASKNAIYDEVETRANIQRFKFISVDAGAMVPRTTNGAEAATEEYATNDIMSDHFLFSGSVEEGVQFKLQMPDDWDRSSIKMKFFWDAATGATAADGVTWGAAALAVSDNDAIDGAAFPTSVDTDDTVIAVGDLHVVTSASISVGGTPVLGDEILFEITRVVGDVNDDMTEDAKLLGVQIEYQTLTTEAAIW